MRLLLAAIALSTSFACSAAWQLDTEQSQLRFVSVKNGEVAEVHKFTQLSGRWADDGKVAVQIPVATLDTLIPIRNERVLEHVLKANQFPQISASATIAPKLLSDLKVGASMQHSTQLSLTLLGQTQVLPVQLTLTKLANGKVQASTTAPVLINSASFKLEPGIRKLQELAKLNDISLMVPVTFNVEFKKVGK